MYMQSSHIEVQRLCPRSFNNKFKRFMKSHHVAVRSTPYIGEGRSDSYLQQNLWYVCNFIHRITSLRDRNNFPAHAGVFPFKSHGIDQTHVETQK